MTKETKRAPIFGVNGKKPLRKFQKSMIGVSKASNGVEIFASYYVVHPTFPTAQGNRRRRGGGVGGDIYIYIYIYIN